MTIEQLGKEISAIQEFIEIIQLPVISSKDYILRCYIETESLRKTKTVINGICKENGTKYQINDIRDLIVNGAPEVHENVNDLAYKIYQANKKSKARR